MKVITAVLIGAGLRGGWVYAAYAQSHPEDLKIVAVAEPDEERRNLIAEVHGIPEERCYQDYRELLEEEKMADCALVCTQDTMHFEPVTKALEKGYHVLCEKPMSPDASEIVTMGNMAEKYGRILMICHVLRYSSFFSRIKNLIEEDRLGRLISIQHIEEVGYWHHAHSFVRGNWRRSDETSPMILQKCCHDMDLLLWLTGKTAQSVSSFGSTYLFKPEMAPEGAALRCMDGCAAKAECPFDAEKIYLTNEKTGVERGNTGWPCNILTLHPTPESVREAIQNGPYGRCVYHCDNNVVDHQVVNICMTDGSTISFTMSGFTEQNSRFTKFMGTKGEILADLHENTIQVQEFGKEPEIIDVSKLSDDFSGHAGGDNRMVEEFLDMIREGREPEKSMTTLERSVESHYIALAAEKSRLKGGRIVEMEEMRQNTVI